MTPNNEEFDSRAVRTSWGKCSQTGGQDDSGALCFSGMWIGVQLSPCRAE